MPERPSLTDQIAAVRRELALRERVYPRWVDAGRMKQAKADTEIVAMRAVLATLAAIEPPPQRADGAPSSAPWNLLSSSAPSGNGSFHLYVVDASQRKIAALWGSEDEKLANGALICDARNGIPDA